MARRMLAPINSIKHYVPQSLSTVASGAVTGRSVINTVVAPATASADTVKEGSVVKAVYIELWLLGGEVSGTNTSFLVALEKRPSGAPAMTFANTQNLGAYINKKNILYTTQGVLGSDQGGQGAVPVLRAWFKIPKGKQRFGLGDRVVLNVSALANELVLCGQFIYKEYT